MFALAPTDLDWFRKIRSEPLGRKTNFWTPTPWAVKGLKPGDRLYFMLKSPIRKVGGWGDFARYADMTAEQAWSEYGLGNGVASRDELVSKINLFGTRRAKSFVASGNPTIGCIELVDVVALDDDRFISPQDHGVSFPRQVVKLKYFHGSDGLAQALQFPSASTPFALVEGVAARKATLRKERKSQSAFRLQILQNYSFRCAVVGEPVVELLEAAHIQPYVDERSNHPQNGICLRVDLHRLFDEGLLAVADDFALQVSPKLAGTSYAALNGRKISIPSDPGLTPSIEALRAHRSCFR
jgi:putative restriction endonuclease